MNNIVGFIFRFVNFGVLIGIIVYFFKTKLSKILELRVVQKESVVDNLRSTQMLLENKETDLEQKKEQQSEEYAQLKQKMQMWNDVVDQTFLKKSESLAVIKEKATKRAKQKALFFTQNKLQKQAIDSALVQAQKALEKKFKDSKESERFLQNILTFMEQNHDA